MKSALCTIVDVHQLCIESQFGLFEQAGDLAIIAAGRFAVDQQ